MSPLDAHSLFGDDEGSDKTPSQKRCVQRGSAVQGIPHHGAGGPLSTVTLDTTRWRIYMAFAGGLESQPPRCKRLHLSIHSLHFTMGNSIIRRAWVEMFPVMMHMQYMWRLKSFTWSTNMWTPLVTSDVFCGVMRSHIPDSCKSVLFYVSFGFFFCLRSSRK